MIQNIHLEQVAQVAHEANLRSIRKHFNSGKPLAVRLLYLASTEMVWFYPVLHTV